MNVLLNAYEYWRYENINKQTFKQLDITDQSRVTGSVRFDGSDISRSKRTTHYGSEIGSKVLKKKPRGEKII